MLRTKKVFIILMISLLLAGAGYRNKMKLDDVVAEIKRVSGTQLSPRVVEAFLQLVEEGTIYEGMPVEEATESTTVSAAESRAESSVKREAESAAESKDGSAAENKPEKA